MGLFLPTHKCGASRPIPLQVKYEVFLPLPPACLSPNARPHWAQKSKAVKAYRALAGLAFRFAQSNGELPATLPLPVRVQLQFFTQRGARPRDGLYRPRDADNAIAALKSAKDSLADVGLIPSDAGKNLKTGEVEIYSTKKECNGRIGVMVILETTDAKSEEDNV